MNRLIRILRRFLLRRREPSIEFIPAEWFLDWDAYYAGLEFRNEIHKKMLENVMRELDEERVVVRIGRKGGVE
jgi:hypothetical protein